MSKDYYKILNVDKSADQDEIKRAFRKLAHQYHPDKQGGDEKKFKEINEAYQVLGNAEKRKQYDEYGSTFEQMGGFGGGMGWDDFMKYARGGGGGFSNVKFDFGDLDLGDIFGDFFGSAFGGGNARRQRQSYGEDIQIDIQIDFKEAVFGAKKQVELYKTVKCGHCHGNLAEPGTKIVTCSKCGGQGRISRVQQTILGAFQTAIACPDCGGEGKKAETPCSNCRGQGIEKKKQVVEFEIPAGIENGAGLKLSGRGNAGARGGVTGDLYLQVNIRSDKRFKRRGNDVFVLKKINFVEAAIGAKVEVETLDGTIELKIPAGTQPCTKFRLRSKGVPYLHSAGRGDLYIETEVEIPRKLNRRQKKILGEFFEDE